MIDNGVKPMFTADYLEWFTEPENRERIGLIKSICCSDHHMKVLIFLQKHGKFVCVGDICNALKLKQSQVSFSLRYLRRSRLVKFEKRGHNVFYQVDVGAMNRFTLRLARLL
jgi:DNA-binding transcriptional ArsR family regulator